MSRFNSNQYFDGGSPVGRQRGMSNPGWFRDLFIIDLCRPVRACGQVVTLLVFLIPFSIGAVWGITPDNPGLFDIPQIFGVAARRAFNSFVTETAPVVEAAQDAGRDAMRETTLDQGVVEGLNEDL